jgi:hypothetical protein
MLRQWKLGILGACACSIVACDSEEASQSSGSEQHVPEYKTEVVLSDGTMLQGTAAIQIRLYEATVDSGDEAEIVVAGGQQATASAVVSAVVPASDVLEASWDALIAPRGAAGARSSASVTVQRGGEEILAESGTIEFELVNGTIQGRTQVEPAEARLSFSGAISVECYSSDGEDPSESTFCQQFSSVTQQ